jgi:hypothetical protein
MWGRPRLRRPPVRGSRNHSTLGALATGFMHSSGYQGSRDRGAAVTPSGSALLPRGGSRASTAGRTPRVDPGSARPLRTPPVRDECEASRRRVGVGVAQPRCDAWRLRAHEPRCASDGRVVAARRARR